MENVEIQRIFSALGSSRRRQILADLAIRKLSVSEVAKMSGLTRAGASQYLTQLKKAGLVFAERSQYSIIYRLKADTAANQIHQFVENTLAITQQTFRQAQVTHSTNNHLGGRQSTFRAMCSPHRRRIVTLLAGGELSVENLAARCNLSRENTSFHLAVLKKADFVTFESQSAKHLYRLIAEAFANALNGYADGLLAASQDKS